MAAPPFLTSSARAGALQGAVEGGESPARWWWRVAGVLEGAASRCSLPQGRGPRAASRRARRAIEDGASTGEVEDGGTRAFPSRAGRTKSPGVDVDEDVGAGEGGGGAGHRRGRGRRRSERGGGPLETAARRCGGARRRTATAARGLGSTQWRRRQQTRSGRT